MKKSIRIIIPLVLILAIIVCTGWYLFIYDQAFTRDVLLHAARYFESTGNHTVSAWFYNNAYKQAGDNDSVAIELAEQYKSSGNYTKAEYTLSKAIADGGGVELYIALCKTYVEQDKLLDAVNMLNNVANKDIRAQLEILRPAAPTCTPDPITSGAYYSQYITVTVEAEKGTLYVTGNGEFPSVEKDKYEKGITLKEGENKIYAVAVSENGLVSPTAMFGFTVGGVIEKVTFADAAVETALREQLGVDANKTLYTKDLWTIKEFAVPEGANKLDDLQHLAFLEKLTVSNSVSGQLSHISRLANLKELEIYGTTVTSDEIPVIGQLPNLQKLIMKDCKLSTIAGLENAKALVYLDLSNNTIRNITPLQKLEKLQHIDLSQNALNDLTAMSELLSLTHLNVSFNNLSTLSPISSLVNLKNLIAGNNALTEISGLEKLTVLSELELSHNTLSNIDAISSCSSLHKLDISNNAITDISVLSSLAELSDLNFSNNKITKLPQWSKDCALVNIDGSYNQLKTLEPLRGLKKLNNIFMDYNKEISSVKALADCPVLIQVNVYGTKVTQVSALTSQNIIVNYDPTR